MLRLLDLPHDLLLRLILHHFTLQEAIPLRILCHELYDLVHYSLARRRSLKLFFSFAELQAYTMVLYEQNLEYDHALRLHCPGPSSDELILHYHSFHNPLVDLVDGLFPNVTHLIIFFHDRIFRGSTSLDNFREVHLIKKNIPYLISRMCTRLSGLSLFGHIRGDTIGHCTSRRLVHSINQCHNLRRLDLCVKHLHLCSNNEYHAHMDDDEIVQQEPAQPFLVIDPRLLNKLERISVLFCEGHGPRFCKHSFQHLGPNLTQLVMHQLYASEHIYVPEPLLCHLLIGRTNGTTLVANSITHLKLTQHLCTLLPKVLHHFTAIKSLDLTQFTFSKTESVISLLELFGLLAQFCPQLTDLKLAKFALGWVRQAEQNDLPQLEHISKLVLKCVHQRHYYDPEIKPEDENIPFDKFLSTFAYILPNLEVLNLKTVSGYFSFNGDGDSIIITDQMQPCMRLLSIGYYSGTNFTCHHLLSEQYRKRYIHESGEGWTELEKHWVMYSKDLDGGSWKKLNSFAES